MRVKIKILGICMLTFIMITSLISMGYAAGVIKVIYNHQEVNTDIQPIVSRDTVYIPLPMIADMFNKNIVWDKIHSEVKITDKPDYTADELRAQIAERDYKIQQLEYKIKILEDGKAYDRSYTDMDDLEDDLNYQYGEYEDIAFDIYLYGDEEDITVKVLVDLDEYQDEWNNLYTSDKKDFLQDICDDIEDEYPHANIHGYIRDRSSHSRLLSFTTSSWGTVRLGYEYDLDNLEDELDDDYFNYFNDIELSIKLEGDEDDITFNVYIDYDEYEAEWDDLSSSQIRTFMSCIYDDIKNEFKYADIEGYVYDSGDDSKLARYYRTSSGYSRLIRY
jgi:hypothetical protein